MTRESYKGSNESNRAAMEQRRNELGMFPRKPHRARQLCRVERVKDGVVSLIIPCWSTARQLDVSRTVLPPEWRVVKGVRFFCVVNLAAENAAELLPGPPFEEGGASAKKVTSWEKVRAAVQAAPRSRKFQKAPTPKAKPIPNRVPVRLLKQVADAVKRACIKQVGDSFTEDLDISAQDAIRKVNTKALVSAALASWRGET